MHGILTTWGYSDEILQQHLVPAIDAQRGIFQHDDAHVSRNGSLSSQ